VAFSSDSSAHHVSFLSSVLETNRQTNNYIRRMACKSKIIKLL